MLDELQLEQMLESRCGFNNMDRKCTESCKFFETCTRNKFKNTTRKSNISSNIHLLDSLSGDSIFEDASAHVGSSVYE